MDLGFIWIFCGFFTKPFVFYVNVHLISAVQRKKLHKVGMTVWIPQTAIKGGKRNRYEIDFRDDLSYHINFVSFPMRIYLPIAMGHL